MDFTKQGTINSNEVKRMELLQVNQVVNLLGSWEWDLVTNEVLWTDGMFKLRSTPVRPHNLVSFEETLSYVHKDDREFFLEKINALKQKQEVSFDYRIVTDQGETKIVKAWAEMIRDENGKERYIRGTSQDVTKEREGERRLQELNEVFQQAEEMASLGNWQWNITTHKVLYSSSLYHLFGFEVGEIEPHYKQFLKFVHPNDIERIEKVGEVIKVSYKPTTVHFRIIKKDGVERYMKAIVKHFKNNQDEEVLLGTIQDITHEYHLHRQLEEEKQFAQLLIENSVDLIAAYDINGNAIAWNKACEENLNLKKEQVLGRHFTQVFPLIKKQVYEDILKALSGEYIHRAEEKSSISDNYYEYFFIPLRRTNGEVFGSLSISHDVTERKKYADSLNDLNHSLEHKNKELEKSNNELASFSYVASHDLQEPLRKIQTFSHRIQETEFEALSDLGKDYFKRMAQASLRMQTLIEDLLTFSRTTASTRNYENVNLKTVVESVKATLKDSIEEKQAIIEYDELPTVNVIPFQFKQLLENLFLNSIKYSKPNVPPYIKVSVDMINGAEAKLQRDLAGKRFHKISIADNGIGFEQQYAEKVFELFQRLHGKHEFPGTGLGLAICRKVMENHHGFIYANSSLGDGATFTILLPV
jgi:hypothetical protein